MSEYDGSVYSGDSDDVDWEMDVIVYLIVANLCYHYAYMEDGVPVFLRNINDATKLKCSVCEKTFRSKSEMTAHVRVHTGKKPIKCRYCPRRFAHWSNRIAHEKNIHINPKPKHSFL